jgi:hypothetical protein
MKRWLLLGPFWAVVLSIPLTGVWVTGALVAQLDGPRFLPWVIGAIAALVLPLSWEALATWRGGRKASKKADAGSFFQDLKARRDRPRRLKLGTRLLLRTLAVNLAFLVPLGLLAPERVATAVTTRGDWMLDGLEEAAWVQKARARLLSLSDLGAGLFDPHVEETYLADAATEAPPPPEIPEDRALVQLVLPEGIALRPDGLATTTRSGVFQVAKGMVHMTARPPDGSAWRCAFEAVTGRRVEVLAGETLAVKVAALDAEPCTPLYGPDPTWRPSLVFLGTEVVAAEHVVAVRDRAPYTRLELDEEGAKALCEATGARERFGLELSAVVDGETRLVHRVIEKLCDGVVPLVDPEHREADQEEGQTPAGEGGLSAWPFEAKPHPVAVAIPEEFEASIELVASYFRENVPDPTDRMKAVHDWVVTRIVYDMASLADGARAPQDADTVFRQRKGVCAGYANLLAAIAEPAGLEVVYLAGRTRTADGDLAGSAHAWNAVRLDDKWYLIDATWNAGSSLDGQFHPKYRTVYFLTPPEVFGLNHLPMDEGWQLVAQPVSSGDFVRRPALTPAFAAHGLTLETPVRSSQQVGRSWTFEIGNPELAHFSAVWKRADGTEGRCTLKHGRTLRPRCDFPDHGPYQVRLFASHAPQGSRGFVGHLDIVAD